MRSRPRSCCRRRSRSSTSGCRCSPTRCASRAGRSSRWTGGSRRPATRSWSAALERLYGARSRADRRGERRGGAPAGPGRAAAGRRGPGRRRSCPACPAGCCCTAGPRRAGPRPVTRCAGRCGRPRWPRAGPRTLPGPTRCCATATCALEPAYEHDAVVPMATAIGRSAPVLAVDNAAAGTRAFAPINQGPGETAWFGRDTPAAIDRLRFLRDVAGPMLRLVLTRSGPVDLFALAAQGVADGRRRAHAHPGHDQPARAQPAPAAGGAAGPGAAGAVAVPVRQPPLLPEPGDGRGEVGGLVGRAGRGVERRHDDVPQRHDVRRPAGRRADAASSPRRRRWPMPCTTRATGRRPALPTSGTARSSSSWDSAGRRRRDRRRSAGFLGGTMDDAVAVTEEMASICVGSSSRFTLPTWNHAGTPLGVDARRVVELDTTPKVSTGILHASTGVGQIGAGVATAPVECFRAAVRAMARRPRRGGVGPWRTAPCVARWEGGMRAVVEAGGVRHRRRRAGVGGRDQHRSAAHRPAAGVGRLVPHPGVGPRRQTPRGRAGRAAGAGGGDVRRSEVRPHLGAPSPRRPPPRWWRRSSPRPSGSVTSATPCASARSCGCPSASRLSRTMTPERQRDDGGVLRAGGPVVRQRLRPMVAKSHSALVSQATTTAVSSTAPASGSAQPGSRRVCTTSTLAANAP